MQCLVGCGQIREGFALLERLPEDVVPQSFPIHNMLREACRAEGMQARATQLSERMDRLGLANISPEAIVINEVNAEVVD